MGTLLLVLLTWYFSKVWYQRFEIRKPEGLYLRRFHLWKCERGGWQDKILTRLGIKTRRVFLHNILLPDPDRHLHNHPWTRCSSLILWGGYQEQRHNKPLSWYFGGMWNEITAPVYHKIVKVLPNTWTLFFAGYRDRNWGFRVAIKTPNGAIWTHMAWTSYLGVPEDTELND